MKKSMMRATNTVIGLLAHVDAGKTTLSEALLYLSKTIKKMGRVDHKDSVLDNNPLERARGITIYAKEARFHYGGHDYILEDTPGHVDLTSEMENVLPILDYAVLLLDTVNFINPYTKHLASLLVSYHIPTFIFLNKIDLYQDDIPTLILKIKKELHLPLVDMSKDDNLDEIALIDEEVLNEYLLNGHLGDDEISNLFNACRFYPLIAGSALKHIGVDRLLILIERLCKVKDYPDDFKAYVYRINFDRQHQRLTYLKIKGGSLAAKDLIGKEKVDELRLYSGSAYQTADVVYSGNLVAVKGLKELLIGESINDDARSMFKPSASYLKREIVPLNHDVHTLFKALKNLETENPSLDVNLENEKIKLSLSGEIAKEVLVSRLEEEGFEVDFKDVEVNYMETIAQSSYGIGHFEPLRHYAEVHLRLRPLGRGRGVVFANASKINNSYVSYLQDYIKYETLTGTGIGARLTDIEINLLALKTSLKHTVNDDVRAAFNFALRNALLDNEAVLLEPYEEFRLAILNEEASKIIYIIEKAEGRYELSYHDDSTVIMGKLSSLAMNSFLENDLIRRHNIVVEHHFCAYEEVKDPQKVKREHPYDPYNDPLNQEGSIFFKNGAGYHVNRKETYELAHIKPFTERENVNNFVYNQYKISDEEAKRAFARSNPEKAKKTMVRAKHDDEKYKSKEVKKPRLFLVDGYNMLFAMNEQADINYDRDTLINELQYYQALKKIKMWVVFDAYNVDNPSNSGDDFKIIYTAKNQTADIYIQKAARELSDDYDITVVSSDRLVQVAIFSFGAYRMSSRNLWSQIQRMHKDFK